VDSLAILAAGIDHNKQKELMEYKPLSRLTMHADVYYTEVLVVVFPLQYVPHKFL